MGFFGNLLGSTDDNVMANGILGRGEIISLSASGLTMRVNNSLQERKCTIAMNVLIDGVPPFQATAVQRIQEILLSKIGKGVAVPVRVDPSNHSKVYIDFAAQMPVITMARTTGENSAAHILEHGKPIKVILLSSVNAKLKNADGVDGFTLSLTVYEGVDTPYQTAVVNAVPASALPLMYPGSKLHAKLGANGIIIVDWAAGSAG
ncbi:MAG: hypothetical protein K8S54_06210 [Spirochaetia bacterium]|nr:hypothetical protein [Spirochaetia bacterium]